MSFKEEIIQRKHYLDELAKNSDKNISIIGKRKVGKTLLVKEHLKNLDKKFFPVYIDLENFNLTPESFSVEFVGKVLFSLEPKNISDYKNYKDINLLTKKAQKISENLFEIVNLIKNELEKINPNKKSLIINAFKFLEIFSEKISKKITICFDNFENILSLNNFSDIKDILSIINFSAKNVRYIITSSLIKKFQNLNFFVLEMKNFEKSEALLLSKKIFNKIPDSDFETLYKITQGHPYIIQCIAPQYNKSGNIKKSFFAELLSSNGSINNYCKSSIFFYLNYARGETLLWNILRVVSEKDLRLSEIAREIYRSAPVTKAMLERLIAVDLVLKEGRTFHISDEVIKLWLKLTYQVYGDDNIDELLENFKI